MNVVSYNGSLYKDYANLQSQMLREPNRQHRWNNQVLRQEGVVGTVASCRLLYMIFKIFNIESTIIFVGLIYPESL